ncbi:LAFE_0H17458g1_1 [Lachancea fermentati]|uniref:Autophagy-related protein 13 n=1 Tax=Lachancea fermentati TaxID=4955 RepID=A0A1G4ML84_LACFM|nr:LAFE_0H17458g1_1 [Lachancea fermentati]
MTTDTDKQLWELIDNFFLKASILICHSKNTGIPDNGESLATNSWFNIETLGDSTIESEINDWVTFDGKRNLPPLVIETFLDLRRLTPSQAVILKDQDGNPWTACKGTKKSEVMLERWLIQLEKNPNPVKIETEIEEIYRQLVLLFRYLYTLVGLLPASDLQTRISRPGNSRSLTSLINIGTRIVDGSKPILSKGRIGLSKNIIATYSNMINETNVPSHLEQRKITPIHTKYGSLRISVSYRRDCDFHVVDNDDSFGNQSGGILEGRTSKAAGALTSSFLRATSTTSNRSMSISPNTTISPNLLVEPSPQKRITSTSRQFQPFKVGSVGSGSISQYPQGSLTRNPSGSSVVAALRAQRSSNGSITTSTNQLHESHIEPSSVGSGSASKYSSSFGRLRRHSSIRRSDSLERPQRTANKINDSPSGDLLDFMKLLEDKQELKVKNPHSNNVDISSSLVRFQSMRSTNDTLRDDLSMSLSLEHPPSNQQRRRSNSHSPNLSFSPSIHYPSIPMRLSQSHSNKNDTLSDLASRRSSADKAKSVISNINEGFSDEHHDSLHASPSLDEDDDEDLLIDRSRINSGSGKLRSTSPGSIQSVSSSFSKSQLPFKTMVNFSHPTTMATPAHAKLHKAIVGSSDNHVENANKKEDANAGDEDDDLLFFMSDMNLSKQ